MEETTITNQHQLKEEINKQYPIDDKKPDTHTKIYAIHTILYAIVSVWLRFFKDKDISILFASLREKNKVDFDYIKTLLNQFKEYAAETVAKSAASASDLATDSAASAAKHPASVDAAVIAAKKAADFADSTANSAYEYYMLTEIAYGYYMRTEVAADAAESAERYAYSADSAAYAATSRVDDVDTIERYAYSAACYAKLSAKCVDPIDKVYADRSIQERSILYLISAYLYLKK